MTSATIFKQTYANYLHQIKSLDLKSLAVDLGIEIESEGIRVLFLGADYCITFDGIADANGRRPPLAVCVILCRYLLMYSRNAFHNPDLVTFRNFKDAGPLRVFFSHSVEGAIARGFSGRTDLLVAACRACGGEPLGAELAYEVKYRFQGLPRVPVYLLFNNAEEEFEANCTLLFERSAENYLDMECVAMLGRALADLLMEAISK